MDSPAAKKKAGGEAGWYSPDQIQAYRQWLAAPPPPFWTAPPAPPSTETATDDDGDAPEDIYVVLDPKDPEV